MPDIPFSNKILHDVRGIIIAAEEGRLTEKEASQLIDKLERDEVKSHHATGYGHGLIAEKVRDKIAEIENDVRQELQQRQLADLRKEQSTHREQENYRGKVEYSINTLDGDIKTWQVWYNWLQFILLFFSAFTIAMAGIDIIPRWGASITSLIATVTGAVLTTFKYQDRIYVGRRSLAELKLMCQKYDHHIDEYKNMNASDAFIKFSRDTSAIQEQQMLQEAEFWNPRKKADKTDKAKEQNQSETP